MTNQFTAPRRETKKCPQCGGRFDICMSTANQRKGIICPLCDHKTKGGTTNE